MSEDITALQGAIERYSAGVPTGQEAEAHDAFLAFRALLSRGHLRAAERGTDGQWRANAWVKAGILLGFRLGRVVETLDRIL